MLLQVEESVQPLTLRDAWGRMQAEGSVKAFFRGNGTNALKIAPETAIKLALNDYLKHALGSSQRRRREEAEQRAAVAAGGEGDGGAGGGAGGGAAAAAAATPAAATEAAAAGARRRPPPSPPTCDPGLGTAGVDRDTAELGKLMRVAIGGVSGAVGQGLVYPLDTVRTRLAVCSQQEYQGGIARTAMRMWRQEGPASLYRGLVPSMCGILPYAGVDIVLFETLKAELLERHGGALPDLAVLAAGMASSVIAQFVSYPLALVRTRLQAQGSAGRPVKYKGMADVFRRTLRHEGVAGLYKGLLPNLVKLAPAAGISWYVFESTKRLLGVDPRS
jgi:solute carrier family 25 (mitochondrial phosphate transporter), member 23/24/25/41